MNFSFPWRMNIEKGTMLCQKRHYLYMHLGEVIDKGCDIPESTWFQMKPRDCHTSQEGEMLHQSHQADEGRRSSQCDSEQLEFNTALPHCPATWGICSWDFRYYISLSGKRNVSHVYKYMLIMLFCICPLRLIISEYFPKVPSNNTLMFPRSKS